MHVSGMLSSVIIDGLILSDYILFCFLVEKSTSLIRHRVDGIQLTLTILRRRNHTRLHAFTPGVLKFVVARTSALLEPRSALATTAGFTFDLTTLWTL